jgi:gas vesicle protein
MASDKNDATGYLGWFLFGAALGAAAALLTTPRTGRETRDLLAERGSDVARRAQEFAQGRPANWLDKSRELFEEQTQRLVSAVEAGRDAMKEEIRKWSPPSG